MVVKAWVKILFGILLSLMLAFTSIGYAAYTDNLSITGAGSYKAYEGIYITKVERVATSSASTSSFSPIENTTTVDTTLRKTSSWSEGTVTYKITVVNNTKSKYSYVGVSYNASESGYGGNSYIGNGITITTKDNQNDSSATFDTNDYIESGETRVFYATYRLSNSLSRNTDYKTLVHYKFGRHVESSDEAADAILIQFKEILNDRTDGGSYQTLIDKIDDKYDGTYWKANFIGNVVGAHNEDTETINAIFGHSLNLTVDGKLSDVTVLIKRENIDGNEDTGDDYTATHGSYTTSGRGCEMTIYMTTEQLDVPWSNVTVYAAVYTCDNNDGTLGSWRMIGDIYKGRAMVVGYTGSTESVNSGSFSTDDWYAYYGTYTVKLGKGSYSYSVADGADIESIIQTKADTNIKSLFDNLIEESEETLANGELAGPVMLDLEIATSNAKNFAASYVQGTTTRAELISVAKNLNEKLLAYQNAEASHQSE